MNNIDKRQYGWLIKGFYSSVFSRIALFLILGILVAGRLSEVELLSGHSVGGFDIQMCCWCLLLVLSAIMLLISTLCKQRREWIFIVLSNLFFFSCGGFLLSNYQLPVAAYSDANSTYTLQLVTEPVLKNNYFRADAVVIECSRNDSCLSVDDIIGAKIIINIEKDSILEHTPHLADSYLFHGKIFMPRNNGNPYAFDYGDYLLRHGYSGLAYCHPPYCQYISSLQSNQFSFAQRLEAVRCKLINQYRKAGISGDNLSIITAITLGDKSMLSSDLKSDFSAAGVQHILVVSGLHVGFIFMIIILVLRRIRRKAYRSIATFAGIAVLWSYALLTGLAPAVVRAAVMFTIMLLFYVRGEYYRTCHALMIAAVITLVANPYLIFDVGFLLSYGAVLSISFFYPKLFNLYRKLGVKSVIFNRVMQAVVLTVSAQILTFPIVIYSFYQFPTYFIITNIVATFLTPILFCGGMFTLLASNIPYVGVFVGKMLIFIVNLFGNVVSFISNMPMSIVNGWLTKADVATLYLVILAVVNLFMMWRYINQRYNALVITASVVLLGLTVNIVAYAQRTRSIDMYQLNQKRLCVNIILHQQNVVFASVSDTVFLKKQLLPMQLRYDAPIPKFVTTNAVQDNYFQYKGKTYLVLRDNPFRYKTNKGNRLDVDCLVIGQGIYPSQRLFDLFVNPKEVYLTAGVWSGYIPQFKQLLDERGITLCDKLPSE